MKATFRLAADLEVTVENAPHPERRVGFTITSGTSYGVPGEAPQEVHYIPLGRNEARAIGSALMGCAAEV